MLKVLRVVSDLYPSVVGGIGLHAYEMSKRQKELGCDITIYTSRIGKEPLQEIKEGLKIFRFKPIITIMGNTINPKIMIKIFNNVNDYDLIHAHSHLYFSTNACSLLKKINSVPLVITTHGLIGQTAPIWFSNIYLSTIGKFTLESADMIISYTEVEKKYLIGLGIPEKKIRVIHNGIDVELFSPVDEKIERENKQILWVGRFVPGKGVEYLIEAINILAKKHHNFRLLMIGKGPMENIIKQKIQDFNLENRITIQKFIPNSELPKIYQNSDIFVLPSLEEGVPRTILEAMSCGIPVVCSNLPQLVNIISDGGFLIPTKDPETLADKVSIILSDESLAGKMGQSGRENVILNYSWSDTVEKTIQLYSELI